MLFIVLLGTSMKYHRVSQSLKKEAHEFKTKILSQINSDNNTNLIVTRSSTFVTHRNLSTNPNYGINMSINHSQN